MYNLVSRISDGLGELKKLLETHIHNQGLAAIEKCGESALNVSRQSQNRSRLSPSISSDFFFFMDDVTDFRGVVIWQSTNLWIFASAVPQRGDEAYG